MEDSKEVEKVTNFDVLCTPIKSEQSFKFYVRRKHVTLQNEPKHTASWPQEIKDYPLMSSNHSCSENSQDDMLGVKRKEEITYSTQELGKKLEIPKMVEDDSPSVKGSGKRNPKATRKKQRFHRPRILEQGRKPRNPATTRLRTISKKRKKKDSDNEEVVVEPGTPEKYSAPKKHKTTKIKKNVARALTFNQENTLSCLELNRLVGPNFPKGRKRMIRHRRSIWRKKSKRSKRRKNIFRWAEIALSFKSLRETQKLDNELPSQAMQVEVDSSKQVEATLDLPKENSSSVSVDDSSRIIQPLERSHIKDSDLLSHAMHVKATLDLTKDSVLSSVDVPFLADDTPVTYSSVTPKRQNKKTRNEYEHLFRQIIYQKDHGLSSLADVSLHMEDAFMNSASYVVPQQPIKKVQGIAKLIKEMKKLKINNRVTTTIKVGEKNKELVAPKVHLDPETKKEWALLMVNDLPDRSYDDKETEFKWKRERDIFQTRIDLFINQMHLLQGDRKFKQWKGSVVDSIVGVFLTQNTSDFLSSNAFISVAAKFPIDATEESEDLPYYIKEPQNVNDSMVYDKAPTFIGEDKLSNEGSIQEAEEQKQSTTKRINKKTGILEDEQVDWKNIRKMYTKEGFRDKMYADAVNWNTVRSSGQHVFATIIRQRGQFRVLAERITKFLDDEAKLNKSVDLEWLRDAPSDLVKRYLLEIKGLGLKSAECVRLLGLKHSAFPVDTNVGRIAVRLGWVPLEPLPEGVQLHQLYQYPSMDSIQKYLWPRLCKLPQETLYELHYQLITFGKVFCTKVFPNCNACPMKSQCKYFASAYVSSKVLLEGSNNHTNPQDGDANVASNIQIEEYVSDDRLDQTSCYEPLVEFPSSPTTEVPELIDIEDFPCKNSYQQYDSIPEIGVDIDALKKNVEYALLERREFLRSCKDEVSKALVVLTPENACIPITPPPTKMTYYNRLRTEHVVYVLPDDHELLCNFERREHDDPSPYLLAVWQPGETSNSISPPTKKCDSDGSNLCIIKTCSYCSTIREQTSNIFRGTILIPCRTAMRGFFPLNGTYFQTNEVFADHETSLEPIVFRRELCYGLETRALYCGSSVTSIFRFLDKRRIQLSFWTGFLCMRAFDRKSRNPQELVRRLHIQPDKRGKKHMKDFDE